MFARVIYAMQWYFLAPVTVVIASAMHVPLAQSGLLPFYFIAGAAVAQIPAGVTSSKISPRWVYVLGLGILSTSDLTLSLSNGFSELLALRFIAGIGAGFFFSPAAAVLIKSRENRAGMVMGLYNTAFNIGGTLALLWGIPEVYLGWRAATAIGGAIGLVLAFENLLVNLKEREVIRSSAYHLSLERPVLILGLSTAGFWGANYASGSLMASYAQIAYHASPSMAGVFTSMFFVGSAIGGITAKYFDKTKRKLTFIGVFVVLTAATYGLILLGLYAMVVAMTLNGFLSNMATSAYYAHTSAISRNFSFALSTVNFLNMAVGVWISPLFTLVTSISLSALPLALALVSIAPLALWALPGSHVNEVITGKRAFGGPRTGGFDARYDGGLANRLTAFYGMSGEPLI